MNNNNNKQKNSRVGELTMIIIGSWSYSLHHLWRVWSRIQGSVVTTTAVCLKRENVLKSRFDMSRLNKSSPKSFQELLEESERAPEKASKWEADTQRHPSRTNNIKASSFRLAAKHSLVYRYLRWQVKMNRREHTEWEGWKMRVEEIKEKMVKYSSVEQLLIDSVKFFTNV